MFRYSGAAWQQLKPWQLTGIGALAAVSRDVAYALSSQGALARTDDGGQQWTKLLPAAAPTYQGDAVSATTAFGAQDATDAGAVLRSGNGGRSWDVIAHLPGVITQLDFPSAGGGVAVTFQSRPHMAAVAKPRWRRDVGAGGPPAGDHRREHLRAVDIRGRARAAADRDREHSRDATAAEPPRCGNGPQATGELAGREVACSPNGDVAGPASFAWQVPGGWTGWLVVFTASGSQQIMAASGRLLAVSPPAANVQVTGSGTGFAWAPEPGQVFTSVMELYRTTDNGRTWQRYQVRLPAGGARTAPCCSPSATLATAGWSRAAPPGTPPTAAASGRTLEQAAYPDKPSTLLISGPRRLRVVPVRQVTQVDQGLHPAGRRLAAGRTRRSPPRPARPCLELTQNPVSTGGQVGQQLLTARILDKLGDRPQDVGYFIRSEHQMQQRAPTGSRSSQTALGSSSTGTSRPCLRAAATISGAAPRPGSPTSRPLLNRVTPPSVRSLPARHADVPDRTGPDRSGHVSAQPGSTGDPPHPPLWGRWLATRAPAIHPGIRSGPWNPIVRAGRDGHELFLSTIRKGQEIALDALKPLVEAVHYVIPTMPVVRVPLAGLLPTAHEVVVGRYEFAEHLLANQRQFARGDTATSPLRPGREGPRAVAAKAAKAA